MLSFHLRPGNLKLDSGCGQANYSAVFEGADSLSDGYMQVEVYVEMFEYR